MRRIAPWLIAALLLAGCSKQQAGPATTEAPTPLPAAAPVTAPAAGNAEAGTPAETPKFPGVPDRVVSRFAEVNPLEKGTVRHIITVLPVRSRSSQPVGWAALVAEKGSYYHILRLELRGPNLEENGICNILSFKQDETPSDSQFTARVVDVPGGEHVLVNTPATAKVCARKARGGASVLLSLPGNASPVPGGVAQGAAVYRFVPETFEYLETAKADAVKAVLPTLKGAPADGLLHTELDLTGDGTPSQVFAWSGPTVAFKPPDGSPVYLKPDDLLSNRLQRLGTVTLHGRTFLVLSTRRMEELDNGGDLLVLDYEKTARQLRVLLHVKASATDFYSDQELFVTYKHYYPQGGAYYENVAYDWDVTKQAFVEGRHTVISNK